MDEPTGCAELGRTTSMPHNLCPKDHNLQRNMIRNPVSTSHQVSRFKFVISGVSIDFLLPHASSKAHITEWMDGFRVNRERDRHFSKKTPQARSISPWAKPLGVMGWDKKRLSRRRKVRRLIEITKGICIAHGCTINFLWTMASCTRVNDR